LFSLPHCCRCHGISVYFFTECACRHSGHMSLWTNRLLVFPLLLLTTCASRESAEEAALLDSDVDLHGGSNSDSAGRDLAGEHSGSFGVRALHSEQQAGKDVEAHSARAENLKLHMFQEAGTAVRLQQAMRDARAALSDMAGRSFEGEQVSAATVAGVATKSGVLAMVAQASGAIQEAKAALKVLQARRKARRHRPAPTNASDASKNSSQPEYPDEFQKEAEDEKKIDKALDEFSNETKNAEKTAKEVDASFGKYDGKLEELKKVLGELTAEAHSYHKQILTFFKEAETERYSPLAHIDLELDKNKAARGKKGSSKG